MRVDLVGIDIQRSFCDPALNELFVPGAAEDTQRTAAMIRRLKHKLNDIHLTLDSHHQMQIFHPMWWKDAQGNPPAPFTLITADDIRQGVWTTAKPGLFPRSKAYVEALEANGRYVLCIWPYHCLIGTPGHNVMPDVLEAVFEWERERGAVADFVTKGSNLFTEHYSAITAEVPDPKDPGTQINTDFIQTLVQADMVVIVGQALSHCVANTVRDIANNFGNDSYISKLWLATDATSAVPGFETQAQDFLSEMTARGMHLTTTTDFLA